MTLAVNIGNTRITFGLFDSDELIFSTALTSDIRRCINEYAVLTDSAFRLGKSDLSMTDSVIISSVVPPLSKVIASAIEILTGYPPVFVEAGIKTGLDIKIDHHTQLGADIVANTAAAFNICQPPFTVIDISDATTFSAVNKNGELCGVVIAAGLCMSLNALTANTAELPFVYPIPPKSFFGKNTADSMISGAVYGHACIIDGIIDKICVEFNSKQVNIIATGFNADLCLPYCRHSIDYDSALTLRGLNKIQGINSRNQKRYNQP
ncbi:MAG: type III pantothenate kinase [Eubacteriales bacterium]